MSNTALSPARKTGTLRLVESAIMIALGTILSFVKIIDLPFGGSITAFSMLPVAIIAYRYGWKWGTGTAAVYALMQMLVGMSSFRYAASFVSFLTIFLFDYLVAFGVIGLSGIFRKRLANQGLALAFGLTLAGVLRYLCHVISALVVWKIFAPDTMDPTLYCFSYNASYMLPEIIINFIGALLLCQVLDFTSHDIARRSKKAESVQRNQVSYLSKMVGIGVFATGALYLVYDLINAFIAQVALNPMKVAAIIAATVIVGTFIFLLSEITQLLDDLRHR